MAQKPKQHVKYDTVKTIQKRIVYDPDTIPVYFKEVVLGNQIYESWNYGYVVWQSYREDQFTTFNNGFSGALLNATAFTADTIEMSYHRVEYQFHQLLPDNSYT